VRERGAPVQEEGEEGESERVLSGEMIPHLEFSGFGEIDPQVIMEMEPRAGDVVLADLDITAWKPKTSSMAISQRVGSGADWAST